MTTVTSATTPASQATAAGVSGSGASSGASGSTSGGGVAGASGGGKSRNELTADFETFLSLLTTQLKNQDPLQPVESTEFVAQLASFSAVEQQTKTNAHLETLVDAFGNGAGNGLSEWIGVEVRAHAAVPFDGDTALTLYAEPPGGTALSVLVISDTAGKELGRQAVDARSGRFDWSGESAGGELSDGSYVFTLESYGGDGALLATTPVEAFAEVSEVRRDGDTITLVLPDGTTLPADEVTALRGG